jgi:hypothetical protein
LISKTLRSPATHLRKDCKFIGRTKRIWNVQSRVTVPRTLWR